MEDDWANCTVKSTFIFNKLLSMRCALSFYIPIILQNFIENIKLFKKISGTPSTLENVMKAKGVCFPIKFLGLLQKLLERKTQLKKKKINELYLHSPFKHISQECGLSPVWNLMCFFKQYIPVNALLHSSHLNGLSFKCLLLCSFQLSL